MAGFAFTLLAVPFFLLILGTVDAIHLLIMINFAISLALLPRIWRGVDRTLCARLAAGALVGLPIGLMVFRRANVDQLKLVVAIVILGFVALAIRRRPDSSTGNVGPRSKRTSVLGVGALAGGMTTALGMPGPPLVLYLTAVGAPKDVIRSTTLTFFTLVYGAALGLQTATAAISQEVWIAAGVLVPLAAIGAVIGHWLSRRISEAAFRRWVLVLITSTGVYVLLDTLLG